MQCDQSAPCLSGLTSVSVINEYLTHFMRDMAGAVFYHCMRDTDPVVSLLTRLPYRLVALAVGERLH